MRFYEEIALENPPQMRDTCGACLGWIRNQTQERYEELGNYCSECIAKANANIQKGGSISNPFRQHGDNVSP